MKGLGNIVARTLSAQTPPRILGSLWGMEPPPNDAHFTVSTVSLPQGPSKNQAVTQMGKRIALDPDPSE